MQKPLDPMSVERTETPSASYVLRRRSGPARHVIAVAGWVTVISMLLQPVAVLAGTITWDNGGGDNAWSTGLNWSGTPDNTEPTAADNVTLPITDTISLSSGETASNLTFSQTVTLANGDLTLSVGGVDVASGRTATIYSTLAGTNGLTKSGDGTLVLGNVTNLITGGITINAGQVTAGQNVAGYGITLGNNPITINANGTFYLPQSEKPVYIREFWGAGTFNKGYPTLFVNALNDAEFSGGGTVNENRFTGFSKTGPGTQTVTGSAWFLSGTPYLYRGGWTFGGTSGALNNLVPTIMNGTLTIDESVADIDRVPDASAVAFTGGGGTLRYKGGSAVANPSETMGDLGYVQGGSADGFRGNFLTVNVQRNGSTTATLQFGANQVTTAPTWSSVGAMVNFTAGGGTSTDTLGTDAFVKFTTATLQNNVLPGGFVNGRDIATYDVTKGVVPFNAVGGGGTSYVAAAGAGSADTAYANANTTLSADTTWNALKIDGSPTIDLNGNNLTIGSTSLGLMIVKTGGGDAVISNSGTTGKYLQGYNDFAFYIDAGQTLKITAPLECLSNNGIYSRVNKAGPGLLWLAPTENWAGTVGTIYGPGMRFSEGAIRMNPDLNGVGTLGRFQNQRMVLNGGVMELDNMSAAYNPTIGTAAANLRWQSSGGFAAYGADATFSPNITWNAANHIPDGAALLLNSSTADKRITLSGTLNLGTDTAKMYLREFYVYDNTNSATDLAEIRGRIISDTDPDGGGTPTLTYHLVKTGTGTLILSHTNNSYNGATHIKAGLLTLSGNAANSPVEVLSEGTLKLSAAGAAHGIAGLKMEPGATIMTELSGGNAGRLSVSGRVELNNATLSVVGAPRPGGTSTFTLIDNDGSDAVAGIFSGAPERAMVTTDGRPMRISYVGGDGNDVTLQVPRGTVLVVF